MAERWWGSVIVTVRDEPTDRLQRMLDSIAAQIVPGPVEVVIAAPATDLEVVKQLRARRALTRIVVVENPGGARSEGLNRAVRAAAADVVHRVDARSVLPPDYLRRARERLDRDATVGVVGGRQHPVPGPGAGPWARGVARALANPWAAGGAPYRRGVAGGVVDTVYLGSFRRRDLLAIGGYDERLDANEDFELCQRLRSAGHTAWFEPDLVVDYEARASLAAVWRQYDAFGRSKVRYWRLHSARPNARQLVGLVGPAAGVVAGVAALAVTRQPHGALVVAGAVAAGLLAVDQVGATEPAPTRVRLAAALGAAVMPAAWATGAYRAFFRSR